MDKKKSFLLLFDRPQEPVFMPKGDEKTIFQTPTNLLVNRFKPENINQSFADEAKVSVLVKNIHPPNLDEILKLQRHDNFSLFIPLHRRISGKLIEIFFRAKTLDDFLATAVYARDQVNPYLFNYALSVALLHRNDTQNIDLPSFIYTFPDKFVDAKTFQQGREIANIVPEGSRTPIEISRDFTASDLEQEHRLAYFREDIGLNLHHWHWHLVYPFEGPIEIVKKNRRGELFYYMHNQIIARYNIERLCNNMNRARKTINFREPVAEAYFPKLNSLIAGRLWAGRPPNIIPQNVKRDLEQLDLDIDDLERWRNRIFEAIHSGYAINKQGQQVAFTENEGIDILGDIVEASILSINKDLYGDFHNMGHVLFAYIHDPDYRHLERAGVIGDPAVDLRDPIFFRWHSYIDDIFQRFKETLPRYTTTQLNFDQVTVDKVEVNSNAGEANVLNTFWQQSDLDLSRGMDFQPRGSVFVRFTHLQNQNFSYKIIINNRGNNRKGTCRIFLAPKFDERGNPWLFRDHRLLFVEMDRFTVSLKQGTNTIQRKSTDSSLTIPFERTFRDLDTDRPTGVQNLDKFNFCGCGWPQHMLLPRGTTEGYVCQFFVMISNYNDDKIDQNVDDSTCSNAEVFCGIKSKLYPDRRAMGFPFDRAPRQGVNTIQQFLTPNMRIQDVVVKHNNRVFKKRN